MEGVGKMAPGAETQLAGDGLQVIISGGQQNARQLDLFLFDVSLNIYINFIFKFS